MERRTRIRIDLDPEAYHRLERLGDELDMTVPQYAKKLLEDARDGYHAFHLHMAAKHSYMTFLMTFLYLPLLHKDDDFADRAKASIARTALNMFGDAPPSPELVTSQATTATDEFVLEISALLKKYTADRFGKQN